MHTSETSTYCHHCGVEVWRATPHFEFAITRLLGAPRDQVFAAWVEPDRFSRWWGPVGASAPRDEVALDPRPGGAWRATIVAGAQRAPFEGEYREVRTPERLVFTLRPPEAADAEVVRLDFSELAGLTELAFRQAGHLEPEDAARARAGWDSFLDSLEAYLRSNR